MHGYLGIVETESKGNDVDAEGNPKGQGRKEILVTWVPDEVLQRMDVKDREGYKRVDKRTQAALPDEEDGGSSKHIVRYRSANDARLCVRIDSSPKR